MPSVAPSRSRGSGKRQSPLHLSPRREGIGPLGWALWAWQLRKGASREREGEKPPAWELSHKSFLLLAGCFKSYQLQTKRFSDTKEGSTWPVPGLAWHLNAEIQVLRACRQTRPSWLPFAEMPRIWGHSSSPGLVLIVDSADKLIRLK